MTDGGRNKPGTLEGVTLFVLGIAIPMARRVSGLYWEGSTISPAGRQQGRVVVATNHTDHRISKHRPSQKHMSVETDFRSFLSIFFFVVAAFVGLGKGR